MENKELTDEFSFLDILTTIFRYLYKARIYVVSAFVVGILSAVAAYFIAEPQYESTLTAYSINLQDEKAVSLIADLERYLSENDQEQLAAKLGVSLAKVNMITSLKANVEVNKYKTGDSKEGFSVKIRVTDNTILDSLSLGIKRYIESTDYINDQISSTRISLQYNITKTEDELRALDSLKSSLYKIILKGGQARLTSNIVLSDISYISSKRIELNERLSSLRQQLQLCSDIKIIKPFSKFKKKSWPKLTILLLFFVAVSEVIALCLFSLSTIMAYLRKNIMT